MTDTDLLSRIQVGLPDCAGGGEVFTEEWASGTVGASWRPERIQQMRWMPIGLGRNFPGRVIINSGWVEIILPPGCKGELRTRAYPTGAVEAEWRLTACHDWYPVELLDGGSVCVAP